jgi:threonine dehydratase
MLSKSPTSQPPTLDAARENAAAISRWLRRTPVSRWTSFDGDRRFDRADLWLKLELLQVTGSFKLRSALTVVGALTLEQRSRGLVSVSSGNFAIACAFAAAAYGAHVIVYMSKRADPYRVARAEALGADVRLVDDNLAAFREAKALDRAGERVFVHPWDGPNTSLGTASIALELDEQLPSDVETFVVAIGGGSLISGLAPTIRALRPGVRVVGVEPVGAPNLSESVRDGRPSQKLPAGSVADSLCAPFAEQYSFELVRDHVDEIVLVEDEAIIDAMRTLFRASRLVVEPAAATALAAIAAHADRFSGGVCAMVCGSNIGVDRYAALLGGMPSD